MERGREEGGGQLPYLSYKGMFNVKRVMVFVPLWSKIGYRSAGNAPHHLTPHPGGGALGYFLGGYVPPKGVVILKLLV